jgi:acetoin:2,6-dichlorophenolindophenol oxidoreductase subunit beta
MRAPTTIAYWRAANLALDDAMAEDSRVYITGEDLTNFGNGGGPFGVTRGLYAKYGAARVRTTPISEEAIVAAAVGAAMCGRRPVVEIMFVDAALLAYDGLANQAAKTRYMFGGQFKVPMVMRTPQGFWHATGAQNSQTLECVFAQIPGLQVAVPATPADAYGLLLSAIRCDDPVVVLEHRGLYQVRGHVDFQPVPLGRAAIVRQGTDVTVIATQVLVHRTIAVADRLAEEGISVEVIDLRTLFPLDLETIYNSVRRTHHVIVAHEGVKMFGAGAEVCSSITENCWDALDAAPVRLGAQRVPLPYADNLGMQSGILVSDHDIEAAIRALAEGPIRRVSETKSVGEASV